MYVAPVRNACCARCASCMGMLHDPKHRTDQDPPLCMLSCRLVYVVVGVPRLGLVGLYTAPGLERPAALVLVPRVCLQLGCLV